MLTNEKDRKSSCINRITIGRDVDNNIILAYQDVDCHHCCIELLDEDVFRITNLHSATGTFVNGKRVEDYMEMGPFDAVRVGSHNVAWLKHFSDASLKIPCSGLCESSVEASPKTQEEEKYIVDEDIMKKRRAELSRRLKNGETIAFGEGGKIVDFDSDEAIGNIPPGKFSAMVDDDEMKKKREELRKRLLGVDSAYAILPWKPNVETRYLNPIEFLNDVNQFQKFVERYFYGYEIFGEFGEKFPIMSYMRIYDTLKLLKSNYKFQCTYTRDGLGGWMNILAIDESEDGCVVAQIKDIISEHFKDPEDKQYDLVIEQFGKLRLYLDSMSAKKHVYTSFSEMGCLQYLHFLEFGEAFAFEWHAAPCRKYVLTSISDIYSIYNGLKSGKRFRYSEAHLEGLLKLFKCDDDLKPTIVMYENKCSIEWVEFHTHRGIYQRKYEIEKVMLRCENLHGIDEYAIPTNIKLVNDTTHLIMMPLFRY